MNKLECGLKSCNRASYTKFKIQIKQTAVTIKFFIQKSYFTTNFFSVFDKKNN